MTRLAMLAVASSLSIACATTAHAEDRAPAKPPAGSHSVEIEISDVDRDTARRSDRFELLAPEGVVSQLSTRGAREASYEVKTSWRGNEVEVAVDRHESAGAAAGLRVTTKSTFIVGQRILLGRVARAGGGSTEVVAVVH